MSKSYYPQVDSIQTLLSQGPSIDEVYEAQGRDQKGDGGGGIVQVTQSGAQTDGGACWIFDEDLTQNQETFTSDPVGQTYVDLQQSNLSWRTFSVRYGPDSIDQVGMLYLNGFHQSKSGQADPWADLSAGTVELKGFTPLGKWEQKWGYNSDEWTITYDHTSSNRRLERVIPQEATEIGAIPKVDPRWWGASLADPNNPQFQDEYIRWAMLKSSEIAQNTSYNWCVVAFEGTYYWLHQLSLLTGNYFKGTGSLNSDGITRGGLKGLPDHALDYRLSSFSLYDESSPISREDAYNMHGNMENIQIKLDKQTARFGFEKFKVDGNVRNNMQVFNNLGDYDSPTTHLQNSGAWSGFSHTFFNTPSTIDAVYKDLNYVDLGGSGLQQGPDAFKQKFLANTNINVRDTRRNHLLYGLTGSWDDITIEGQYWASSPVLDPRETPAEVTLTNLTVKNLEEGQFYWNNVIASRGERLTLDGFTIDMTGLENTKRGDPDVFKLGGVGNVYKNGTIRGLEDGKNSASGANSYVSIMNIPKPRNQYTEDRISKLVNVDVYDQGEPMELIESGFQSNHRVLLDNVTYQIGSGYNVSSDQRTPYVFGTTGRNQIVIDPSEPRRFEIKNVTYSPEPNAFSESVSNQGSAPWQPVDVYFVNGDYNNPSGGFLTGELDSRVGRVFMDGLTINSYSGGAFHGELRPEINEPARMRNVSDNNGRTSDQVGQSYTATDTDESNGYALIPTSLISRAWETSVTANAGYNVTGVEIANSDGTLRSDDNTGQRDPYLKVSVDGTITSGDTFDWTARVTPTARYSTTGAFVARRKSNETFTSGDGPFEVDLIGIVGSQETFEAAVYSVSIGDTSVVTGSVQQGNWTDWSTGQPSTRPNGAALQSGDIWMDLDDRSGSASVTATLYQYDGSSWVAEGNLSETVYRQAGAPSSPSTGDLWIDQDSEGDFINRYDGSAWNRIEPDSRTLELTEQSTGTTTITVTGEIPGVGTASTSFQVDIQ